MSFAQWQMGTSGVGYPVNICTCTLYDAVSESMCWKSVNHTILTKREWGRDENIIYVKEDSEFEKETWAYQVIMHEISHCARTCWLDDGMIHIQPSGTTYSCEILVEALNSLFTVKIFDYEEMTRIVC